MKKSRRPAAPVQNPRTNALAFRIWQIAEPLGWNISIPEIAQELNVGVTRIRRTVVLKGWSSRVRACKSVRAFRGQQMSLPVDFNDISEVHFE